MNRDDIIRMARDADCQHVNLNGDHATAVERLTCFAALVSAAEREACAKVAEDLKHGLPVWRARENIATAIRARGKK